MPEIKVLFCSRQIMRWPDQAPERRSEKAGRPAVTTSANALPGSLAGISKNACQI